MLLRGGETATCVAASTMVSLIETEDESITAMEDLIDSVETASWSSSAQTASRGDSGCQCHTGQCARKSAKGDQSDNRSSRSRSRVHPETKE